jgi:hypothetical protein
MGLFLSGEPLKKGVMFGTEVGVRISPFLYPAGVASQSPFFTPQGLDPKAHSLPRRGWIPKPRVAQRTLG